MYYEYGYSKFENNSSFYDEDEEYMSEFDDYEEDEEAEFDLDEF